LCCFVLFCSGLFGCVLLCSDVLIASLHCNESKTGILHWRRGLSETITIHNHNQQSTINNQHSNREAISTTNSVGASSLATVYSILPWIVCCFVCSCFGVVKWKIRLWLAGLAGLAGSISFRTRLAVVLLARFTVHSI
jgi:hypothetical protein